MSERRTTLLFQITPQSPLLLGDRSGNSNFQETAQFIPGSTLRGAVAAGLIQACIVQHNLDNHDDCPDPGTCSFHQLFNEDEPYFGNSYPGGSYGPVWPLPLTAQTCKKHSGWRQGVRKPGHGIFDILLTDFAYALVSDPAYPRRAILQPGLGTAWSTAWQPAMRQAQEICSVCDAQMTPAVSGETYYAWQDGPQPATIIPKRRTVHVGINRARGVSEDALLFTQESLTPTGTDQYFYAEVSVPSNNIEALQAAMSGTFHVGRGRSRGYGEVTINRISPGAYMDLAGRLEEFNLAAALALKPYRDEDAQVAHMLSGHLFSLTLRTPAVLAEAGRPSCVPQPEDLRLPAEVVWLQSWSRSEQVGGWHNAARLPRRTQPAVKAGSVFLYYAPATVAKEALLAKLSDLERKGIGENRERGYGRLTVCARYHSFQL